MKSETVFPVLKRTAGSVALVEVLAVISVLGIGSLLRWQSPREYGLALALLGVVMVLLGTFRPAGGWRRWIAGIDDAEAGEASPFKIEMLAVGAISVALGIILLALSL